MPALVSGTWGRRDFMSGVLGRMRALSRASGVVGLVALAVALSSCAATQQTASKKKRSKEYFAESAYGVKASPRVSNLRTNLPRGGGRDQTGQPYMVKGRWYYPKEEPGYSKVGEASWYGEAFHGRLTANGEIYDMTHLTAAHPTMPLPSYARVTNMKNGTSVIVRVNDRGPFERGRVIDLSNKAAEMLDYAHTGMAQVKVDYIGRAPLEGRDDQYLLASYRPGKGAPSINDGLPTGVMIAMNGATPTTRATATREVAYSAPALAAFGNSVGVGTGETTLTLPDFGPIAPERPGGQQIAGATMPALGYAEERMARASAAFEAFDAKPHAAQAIADKWRMLNGGAREYVAVGTYASRAEAQRMASLLGQVGKVELQQKAGSVELTLRGDGRVSTDQILETAWANGAPDAFVVRD